MAQTRRRDPESFLLRATRHRPQIMLARDGPDLPGFFLRKVHEVNQFYLSRAGRGDRLAPT